MVCLLPLKMACPFCFLGTNMLQNYLKGDSNNLNLLSTGKIILFSGWHMQGSFCCRLERPTSSCGGPSFGTTMSALIDYLSSEYGSTFTWVGHILNISFAYLVFMLTNNVHHLGWVLKLCATLSRPRCVLSMAWKFSFESISFCS
jgi:hypothetical protein